jgi:CDP-diacylglycerol--glycerol-3-phosphate 3-phosphatidyltransferase
VLDGYLARTLKQVTSFGRVVDPVVDKVVVLGAFFFFAGPHFYDYASARPHNITGVQMWMVLVILIRELLVSAIRSYGESHSVDFSADWAGKLKMFVQSTTACVILVQLAWFPADAHPGIVAFRQTCIWITVVVTALSIITYARRARSFLFSQAALGGEAQKSAETHGHTGASASAQAQGSAGARADLRDGRAAS